MVDRAWTRAALVRAVGLALTAYVGWAALAGKDLTVNPALGVFYVYLWVAMVPLSLLLGNVWPLLSPVRTLHLGLTWVMRTAPGPACRATPPGSATGRPRVGLFAFVWTELVDPDSAFVSTIVTWCLLYAAAMLVGGALFGTRWFERADPFEVYFGLVARLSPWGRRTDPDGTARIVVRNPLEGLDGIAGRPRAAGGRLGAAGVDGLRQLLRVDVLAEADRHARAALDPELRDTLVLLGFVALVAATLQRWRR